MMARRHKSSHRCAARSCDARCAHAIPTFPASIHTHAPKEMHPSLRSRGVDCPTCRTHPAATPCHSCRTRTTRTVHELMRTWRGHAGRHVLRHALFAQMHAALKFRGLHPRRLMKILLIVPLSYF